MTFKEKLASLWRNHAILIIVTALFALGIATISLQSIALRRANNEKKMLQNNVAALQDSVRITYNKWQQAEYNRQSFVVSSPQDVKALASDLYAELQKMKGEVRSINNIIAKLENRDTVPLYVSVPSPNRYDFLFDTTFSKGNRLAFGGYINTLNTDSSRVTRRDLEMNIFTGLKIEKGKPVIFARTDFPGVNFNLQGTQIDPSFFATKASKEPLINYATLNIGQNVMSYYYGGDKKRQLEFFQPRIDASVGAGINLKKLLSRNK